MQIKRVMALAAITVLCGCASVPSPAIPGEVFLDASKKEKTDSSGQAPSAQASATDAVLRCIALTLEEDAGLKIAGVIAEEGESPSLFAAPEKSGGLLMIRIKDLNLADPSAEVRLTLVLRVFDSSGVNCYSRSITNTLRIDSPQDKSDGVLQIITKNILRQYAKDPVLRPLIMKYRLESLLKFI
jgi:hypothetical protein